MEDDKIYQVGTNIQEKATVIWNVANAVFGIFKPHEYGKVILPMAEDIAADMECEVLPYVPDAWVDDKATKVGYEIPMTRYIYKYQAPEAADAIAARISALESDIDASLNNLFS
ncbi:MAG: hypothetical protein ACI4OX_09235 [Akkermansia sp.]